MHHRAGAGLADELQTATDSQSVGSQLNIGPEAPQTMASRLAGTIKEYSERGWGIILHESQDGPNEVCFQARSLKNGSEYSLVPNMPVSFGLKDGKAVDITLLDPKLQNQVGTLIQYDDATATGFIKPDDGSQHIQMHFDSIIGKVFEHFKPGLPVTYNAEGEGHLLKATNVRFINLPVCRAKIKFYIASKEFGIITSGSRDNHASKEFGRTTSVPFFRAAVVNQSEIRLLQSNMDVTYFLARVPPSQREKYGLQATKATIVVIHHPSLSVIQHVEHPDASQRPQLVTTKAHEQLVAPLTPSADEAADEQCRMVRLHFSRSPDALHNTLMAHPDLKGRLECGTWLFVPQMLHAAIEALAVDLKLGHADAIVPEALAQSVADSVMSLLRRHKIGVKHEGVSIEKTGDDAQEKDDDNSSSDYEEQQQGDNFKISIKNTFVNIRVPSSLCSDASGGARTASTTDVNQRGVGNPRSKVKSSSNYADVA